MSLVNELKTDYQILRNTHISFSYARRRIIKKMQTWQLYANLAKRPILIWILEIIVRPGPETQQKCHDMNRKRKCGYSAVKRTK